MSKRILLHDYGGYAFSVQLARSLARRGHAVCYVYSDTTQVVKRGAFHSRAGDPPNFSISRIGLSRPFEKYSFIKRRSQEIEHGKLVAREIERFQPEIVISADTPLDAQQEIMNASTNQHAIFVFWLQDLIGLATGKILAKKLPIIGAWIGRYYTRLETQLLRKSDSIITISKDFHPILNQWHIPDEKLFDIPNWAPLEEIQIGSKNNPWSQSKDIDRDLCFVYTGILGLKHNPELILQLAIQTGEKVVVVSEGLGAAWLKEKQTRLQVENLVVMDFQPKENYSDILASANVLVAVLNTDAGKYSIPSKVLSYLCARRPILLSVPPENMVARIVREHAAGEVASPDDPQGFICAARRLIADPSLREKYARNARRYAETHFEIEHITQRFESVFITGRGSPC